MLTGRISLARYEEVFDATGNYTSQFSAHSVATGVFAVNSSRIYVADGQNNVVRVFDKNGNPLFRFGGLGNGAGQFCRQAPNGASGPAAIAATENRVYVSDYVNNHVETGRSSY